LRPVHAWKESFRPQARPSAAEASNHKSAIARPNWRKSTFLPEPDLRCGLDAWSRETQHSDRPTQCRNALQAVAPDLPGLRRGLRIGLQAFVPAAERTANGPALLRKPCSSDRVRRDHRQMAGPQRTKKNSKTR